MGKKYQVYSDISILRQKLDAMACGKPNFKAIILYNIGQGIAQKKDPSQVIKSPSTLPSVSTSETYTVEIKPKGESGILPNPNPPSKLTSIITKLEGDEIGEKAQQKVNEFKSILMRLRGKEITLSERAFQDGLLLFEEGSMIDIHSNHKSGVTKQSIKSFLTTVKLVKYQVEIATIRTENESGTIKFTYAKVVVP
jgi:hypothetical protein